MTDPTRLVDELRAFLQSQDQTRSPRLVELAERFVTTCRETNDRLSRCAQMLRSGLRAEALHLADSEPRVLDVVTLLDFPERDAWNEILELYDLPRPPELLLANAEFINDAYNLANPLESLLRQHRRLAIARAPLVRRIAVLRKIAEKDATNTVWVDDQRIYEQIRLREIKLRACLRIRISPSPDGKA